MILNLIAIFVFFAALLAGMALLWRRLPRANAMAVGEAFCLSCGTPARQFAADSFACPTCGRDARELGLAAKKPGAPADPLWRLIGFTVLLCILALSSTAVLLNNLRQAATVSMETEYWGDGKTYQRLYLTANGRWAGKDGPFTGQLDGDLISASGDLATLEIQCPSLHYDIVNDSGRSLVPPSRGAFDEAAVLQWFTDAKLDPADPRVRRVVSQTYDGICRTLKLIPNASAPLQIGSLNGLISSGASGFPTPPDALMPSCVIAWSLLWFLGTWLLLRPPARTMSSPPIEQAVAA